MKLSSQKLIAGGFGLALLLLGSAGFASYTSIQKLHEDQHWIMHTDEQSLSQRRTITAKNSIDRVTLGVILGYGLGGILLGMVYVLVRQKIRAKETLEVRTREYINELAQTNDRLDQERLERQRAEQIVQDLTLKLKQSNQELEQFAYIASHDLQEPLRVITSHTQLLHQEYQTSSPDPALLTESMMHITEGVAQMRVLIKDLLAYSRTGLEDASVSPVDCNQVMLQVLSSLEGAIAESFATITYDTLPTILADRSKIGQIFQNLISNAIKFHQDSPPIVYVSFQQYPQEWRFSVHDNGIGIKPQYLERIFEVFRRLHTRREYPGTGIGLAVCKKLVERQGGQIWAESELGVGTVFHFTVPMP
jgi:signal transduction histidine kinase